MTVNHSIDLFVYGLVVIGLNLVAHWIAPDFAGPMLILLLVGGVVIMLLGVVCLRGSPQRSWPLAALGLVAALLLVQAGRAWLAVKSGVDGMKPVAVILSLLLFFAIMQWLDLVKSRRHLRGQNRGSTDRSPNAEDQKPGLPGPDK